MSKVRQILGKIQRQTAKKQGELEELQKQKELIEAAEAVKASPQYVKLARARKQIRSRLHVIRVNVSKKRQSISFKERDIKALQIAIQQFQSEEKDKAKSLTQVESQIAALESRVPVP